MTRRAVFGLALALVGCGKEAPKKPPEAPPIASLAPTPAALDPTTTEEFPDVRAAFAKVLAGSSPRVVAIGETHATKDANLTRSPTARFTEELLPLFEGKAAAIVVEVWVANGSCGASEKKVAEKQKEVTKPQAETNQNDFVTLANKAKERGIVPFPLVPSCPDYARVLDAGAGDVGVMLEIIAKTTGDKVESLLPKSNGKIVLTYGGALHNDKIPRTGRETWSFGPRLSKAADGKYVEVDLVVPELVKDTDAWKSQPWYAATVARAKADKAILVTLAEGSYAIVFPGTVSTSSGTR